MKWLAGALLIVLVLLQYRLWISSNGVRALPPLEAAVAAQRAQNARLEERNRRLAAEVHDLKNGTTALEERARSELGMIGPNESFYQVVPRASASSGSPSRSPSGSPASSGGPSPTPSGDPSPTPSAASTQTAAR